MGIITFTGEMSDEKRELLRPAIIANGLRLPCRLPAGGAVEKLLGIFILIVLPTLSGRIVDEGKY